MGHFVLQGDKDVKPFPGGINGIDNHDFSAQTQAFAQMPYVSQAVAPSKDRKPLILTFSVLRQYLTSVEHLNATCTPRLLTTVPLFPRISATTSSRCLWNGSIPLLRLSTLHGSWRSTWRPRQRCKCPSSACKSAATAHATVWTNPA